MNAHSVHHYGADRKGGNWGQCSPRRNFQHCHCPHEFGTSHPRSRMEVPLARMRYIGQVQVHEEVGEGLVEDNEVEIDGD